VDFSSVDLSHLSVLQVFFNLLLLAGADGRWLLGLLLGVAFGAPLNYQY
jgi:hypothetical protein